MPRPPVTPTGSPGLVWDAGPLACADGRRDTATPRGTRRSSACGRRSWCHTLLAAGHHSRLIIATASFSRSTKCSPDTSTTTCVMVPPANGQGRSPG
jgi:hypothetical protein